MSEMDEKVEEPQEQAADRPALRDVSPKKLAKILEAHRKWVESEGKEGERADLNDANLQKANLYGANLQGAYLHTANIQKAILRGTNLQKAILRRANLQGADLGGANFQGADLFKAKLHGADLDGANLNGAIGLTASQVKKATNWELAFYSDDFLKKLRLPPDHNE